LRYETLIDPQCGHSKVAEEAVCWEAHEQGKIKLVVIRPGVIYGRGRGVLSGRIGLQVGCMMVRMGGRQQLPDTYVENCAAGIALAATVPGIEGQAYPPS
jgi:nucleoside-diphosphate-sugar epimerase